MTDETCPIAAVKATDLTAYRALARLLAVLKAMLHEKTADAE